MKKINIRKTCLGIVLNGLSFITFLSGCAPHSLFFYEGTKIGLHAEFKPDASQPVNSSLGYKRRIVAVVPPQQISDSGGEKMAKGDALSMISLFSVDVENTRLGDMTITNHFLCGGAARAATKNSKQVVEVMKALRTPDSYSPPSVAALQ